MKTTSTLLVLAGLGMLAIAGCLVSGTFVETLKINAFYSKSDGEFHSHGVDLTTKEVWVDHQDDIKNISDVRVRATIEEQSGISDATGAVYFSDNGSYTTPEAVRAAADAFIVFSGLTVPAGGTVTMKFAQSASYRQNLDQALELVETGQFYIYVLTPEGAFDLYVDDITVMVTFDAGPSS